MPRYWYLAGDGLHFVGEHGWKTTVVQKEAERQFETGGRLLMDVTPPMEMRRQVNTTRLVRTFQEGGLKSGK